MTACGLTEAAEHCGIDAAAAEWLVEARAVTAGEHARFTAGDPRRLGRVTNVAAASIPLEGPAGRGGSGDLCHRGPAASASLDCRRLRIGFVPKLA